MFLVRFAMLTSISYSSSNDQNSVEKGYVEQVDLQNNVSAR